MAKPHRRHQPPPQPRPAAKPAQGGAQPAAQQQQPKALHARLAEAMQRGTMLFRSNKPLEAVNAFDEALALDPDNPEALVNRGVALRRMGRRDEAVASYWRALEAGADRPTVLINAANALTDLGRVHEARAALAGALRHNPRSPEAWQALASLLLREQKSRAAEVCLRRAMHLAPRDPLVPIRIAALLAQDGGLEEALELFVKARTLQPLAAPAHSGYGQTLISMGRLEDAERHLRRALDLDADNLDAHLGLARLLLLRGELDTGWVEYEWRRQKPESKIAKLPGKEWDGSPVAGKTILVTSEQGFGDVLQFSRYVTVLAQQGAKVILAVPGPLARLMQGLDGVSQIITSLKPLPEYDFHVPLLTIPRLTGITLDTIPSPRSYLRPVVQAPRIPVPLGTKIRVGMVWAGSPLHSNDRNRSLALDDMLPLAGIRGVTLYSLQAGPRVGDLTKFSHPALIRDLSGVLGDFAETASVLQQIDLVICADTSIAHLCGALGRPVWVLTPYAPDWRWILGRDDTPWYPSMRLFRQSEPGRWDDVVSRLVVELQRVVADKPEFGADGDVRFTASFPHSVPGTKTAEGQETPRFRMAVPRQFLRDPGLRYLVKQERAGIGYEYATRCFIDAHLQPGDVFVDAGAHWGLMSLHAATRNPGQNKVLAVEPLPFNLPYLRGWVAGNNLTDSIEVIAGAVSDKPGRGGLRPESTMGHILVRTDAGQIPITTLDALLAERPALTGKVMVKIDVEGIETEVVDGMAGLLDQGRIGTVIWERGTSYNEPGGREKILALRERFAARGYTAWRFKSEDEAGVLEPFVEDGWDGNVFELPPGMKPNAAYGIERLPPSAQPPDQIYDAWKTGQDQMEAGAKLQGEGKTAPALAAYATAAANDQRLPDLYNNLGVALRGAGRLAAAEAAYRRAVALQPENPGVLSNLGNVLRERGEMAESEQMHQKALAIRGNDPRLLYNAALVYRDDGKPARAQALLEKTLELDPNNNECKWDLALCHLQQGNYSKGLKEYETRWGLDRSPPRKYGQPRWEGQPLAGKTIFVHDEQGFGDVLMYARFIPELKARYGAARVIVECQPDLMRLMSLAPGIDIVARRGTVPPEGIDYVVALLSLPGIFGLTLDTLPRKVPYLRAPEPELPLPDDGRIKLGLVWAGKTTPRDRSCEIEQLLPYLGDPRYAVYSLQHGPRGADLKKTGANAFITDLGPRLYDFAETAAIMSKLDLLVTIDTSVAHLAGALGLPTFMLLLYTSDWRWFDQGSDSPWYPSLTLFRQARPRYWDQPLARLGEALKAFADKKDAEKLAKAG